MFKDLKELRDCLFKGLRGCLFKDPKALRVYRELVFKVQLATFRVHKALKVCLFKDLRV